MYLKLNENHEIEGKSFDQFTDVVSDIDARRTYINMKPSEMRFLVLDRILNVYGNDKLFGVMIPAVAGSDPDTYVVQKSQADILETMEPDLARECVNTGVFVSHPAFGDEVVPVTASAIADLCNFIGLHGAATEVVNVPLMRFIYDSMINLQDKVIMDEDNHAIVQKNGNSIHDKKNPERVKEFVFQASVLHDKDNPAIKRIFSFRSKGYSPIRQESICSLIDGTQLMGKYEFKSFKVNHHISEAIIGFPDVSDEFTRLSQFGYKVTPCYILRTSDTGRSSLRIQRSIEIDGTGQLAMLPLAEDDGSNDYVFTRHYGATDVDALKTKMNDQLYRTFKHVPEQMSKIAFIGQCYTEKCVRAAFERMGFQKKSVIISAEVQETVVKKIVDNLPPTMDALDIVMTILFCTDDLDDVLTEAQKETLKRRALLALYAVDDYKAAVVNKTMVV